MTHQETQRALHETRLVLYRLVKEIKEQRAEMLVNKQLIEAKHILDKYADTEPVLRNKPTAPCPTS